MSVNSEARREVFRAVKRGVVAVALGHADQRETIGFTTRPPSGLFDIIGTGFVVDESGIVATAANVVEQITGALWEAADASQPAPEPLAVISVFDGIDPADGKHTMRWATQYIRAVNVPGSRDIGFLFLNGLPDEEVLQPLVMSESSCEEGDEVAVCGFPHGLNLHRNGQINASFASGIVSAVLPGPGCPPTQRDKLQIDTQVLDGTNGGPLFDPTTGQILGVVVGNHNHTSRIPIGTTEKTYDLIIPLGFSFAEDIAQVKEALAAQCELGSMPKTVFDKAS